MSNFNFNNSSLKNSTAHKSANLNENFYHSNGIEVFDGGEGIDSLKVNYTRAQTSVVGFLAIDESHSIAGMVFDSEGNQIDFLNLERIQIQSGSADDSFSIFGGEPLDANLVKLNAGEGYDELQLSFSVATQDIFFINNGHAVFSNLGEYKNFEQFNISTGSGNDVVIAGSANDFLYGGDGNDILSGKAGDDHLFGGAGNNSLFGGSGDDVIGTFAEPSGTDYVDGGSGFDIWKANFETSVEGLNVVQDASGVTHFSNGTELVDIENIQVSSGSGDDNFSISGSIFNFFAGQGNDSLDADFSTLNESWSGSINYTSASSFHGYLVNGSGSLNPIFYDFEQLSLTLGDGDDGFTMNFLSDEGPNSVSLNGGAGLDTLALQIFHETEDFTFIVSSDSIVSSRNSFANFEIFHIGAGDGNDMIVTSENDDHLSTGRGNDVLISKGGNDWLSGSLGEDRLEGGAGNDLLTGGLDADQFVFSESNFGNDIIFDFEDGLDKFVFAASIADSFEDFFNTIYEPDLNVLTIGENSITIYSNTAFELSADDFLFV